MSINLIIGADLVPTQSNSMYFRNGDVDLLLGNSLSSLLMDADFSIFNLEVPLFDGDDPIDKYGPNLKASTKTISGLKKINPHFFTLANNHIFDHGINGLYSTMHILNEHGIEFAGVGGNSHDASKPFYKEINGIKIGIYCCSEHEFSGAGEDTAGANIFDPLYSLDDIENLSKAVDFLIVLYHGGKEHYRYPSPNLQKVCRRIVEKGADLVVCQHSHCIGCKEEWRNGTIVYGQGNFLFDDGENEFWNTGLLLKVNVSENSYKIDYIPIKKEKEKVRLAPVQDSETILRDFERRSIEIIDPNFVANHYKEFSIKKINGYLYSFSGSGIGSTIARIINKISGYKYNPIRMRKKYKKTNRIILRNLIECEAHRELIIEGLKNSIQ